MLLSTLLVLGAALLVAVLVIFFVEPLSVLSALERLTPNIVYRVRTDRPLVALSFDDGPNPAFTPQVLNILEAHRAQATFFLIGDRALQHPDLVSRIEAAGHQVANHYFRNGLILLDSDSEFLSNLERTERAIALNQGPDHRLKLFRPPGGLARTRQLQLAKSRGYAWVLGSAYPHDTLHPPVWYIRWLVQKNLRPGTIVILHDGISDPARSLAALPQILAEGRRHGLYFLSIGELMHPAPGQARTIA